MANMLPCCRDVHPSDLFSIVLALFVNYLMHIIQPDLVTALAETALGRRLDRKTRVESAEKPAARLGAPDSQRFREAALRRQPQGCGGADKTSPRKAQVASMSLTGTCVTQKDH